MVFGSSSCYSKPSNKYVADFIGSPSMNFFQGLIQNSSITIGGNSVDLSSYPFVQPFEGDAWFGIRPEHVRCGDEANSCDFSQQISVDLVEPMGSDTLVWAEIDAKPFRFRVEGQAQFKRGDQVNVGFNVDQASLFDESTEFRL